MPATPVAEIGGHVAPINSITWAPHSAAHLCSVGDDYQALIWDLASIPKPVEDPILAYTAEAEVNALVWSPALPEWVAIAFDSRVQILKVRSGGDEGGREGLARWCGLASWGEHTV